MNENRRELRREQIDHAIGSVSVVGLEPAGAAKAIFGRYVAGEISSGEMGAEIRALKL